MAVLPLIVYDLGLKKVINGEEVALEGVPKSSIITATYNDTELFSKDIKKFSETKFLFHVRAPISDIPHYYYDSNVFVPYILICTYVDKKEFSPDFKPPLNKIPFPQMDIDSSFNQKQELMELNDYPFVCPPGSIWDLIKRAEDFRKDNQNEECLELYKRAWVLSKNSYIVCCNIGISLMEMNKNEEAENWLSRAYKISSCMPMARINYGILRARQAFSEIDAGNMDKAWKLMLESVTYGYDREEIWLELMDCAIKTGNSFAVIGFIKTAIEAHKDWKSVISSFLLLLYSNSLHYNILDSLPLLGDLKELPSEVINCIGVSYELTGMDFLAEETLKCCKNPSLDVLSNLSGILYNCGDINACLEIVNENWPKIIKCRTNIMSFGVNGVFMSNYSSSLSEEDVFKTHREWGDSIAEMHKRLPALSSIRKAAPKIKIGYIGSDFREHVVSMFSFGLFSKFDKSKYEVYIYNGADEKRSDDLTAAIKKAVTKYICISGMESNVVAEIIIADGIDILVDLAGLTANTRLDVLARKPAFKQITMIGYPHTTGLPSGIVDYKVVDSITDPLGVTDKYYTEELIRVSGCFLCYDFPSANVIYENASAFKYKPDHKGIFRFSSFAKLPKISDRTWVLWKKILEKTEQQKPVIYLKARIFNDSAMADKIRKRLLDTVFMGNTSLLNRVRFLPYKITPSKHLEDYCIIDCILDTFPYSGTTMTCESLLAGVPFITLRGSTHRQNVSTSILHHSGMPSDWICETEEQYVEKAVEMASRGPFSSQEARQKIRDTFMASPVYGRTEEYVRKIEREVFEKVLL